MGIHNGLDNEFDQTCENCRFFSPNYKQSGGDCRRYAPKPTNVMDSDEHHRAYTYWPEMSPDDWCGEFQWHPAKKPPPPSGTTH